MVQPSSTSSILLRKRTSDSSRRRSGQLGAVKKAPADENRSPGGRHPGVGPPTLFLTARPSSISRALPFAEPAAEPSAQPSAEEEAPGSQAASPPEEPAHGAADDEVAAVAEAEAPTTRFQKLLVDSNAAERWFDDQLTPKGGAWPWCSQGPRRLLFTRAVAVGRVDHVSHIA
jgi:hypothetical protein